MAAVVLLTGVAVSIARCGREKEINAQVMAMKEEQTRQELRMQQEYGCDIYGQYEYPYIICEQNDVDYEMVFALIERESKCVWNADGGGGASVGLMQIAEKWQQEHMEELNCTDLTQPFQNVRVGVDILSELQEKLKGTVPAEQLPYDVLAAYNYGLRGVQKNLWAYGVHEYEYNRAILKRAQELKQETKEAKEEKQ